MQEEAELVWQAESSGKKDVEKMLEMINKAKEVEKENDALLQRLEEVYFSTTSLSYVFSSVTC